MSRNKNRVGGTQPQDTSPPPQQLTDDGDTPTSGFSFVVPTEFVELPSKGRFYDESHPLHGSETLEIRHMTAKEEDILTSRTLLKKGVALDRVIQSLIVNQSVKADHLLVGDRNALIIATRIAGYGSEYSTQVVCPACGTTQDYSFYLHELETYTGDEDGEMEIEPNKDGTFDVSLPTTGVVVTIRLLTGADEKRFLNRLEADRKQKRERNVTSQLRNMITAVNGDDSPEAITYLAENIPAMDSRYLRGAYRLCAPDIDLTQTFECEECYHESNMEVPLSAEFFWPKQ